MSDRLEDFDARLARLRDATSAVGPRPDFAARVAAAVAREEAPSDWLRDLLAPARWLVPAAAIAAAVSVVWAAESAHARHTDPVATATELDTEW